MLTVGGGWVRCDVSHSLQAERAERAERAETAFQSLNLGLGLRQDVSNRAETVQSAESHQTKYWIVCSRWSWLDCNGCQINNGLEDSA